LFHKSTFVLQFLLLGLILITWELSSAYIPQTILVPPSKVFPLFGAIWINANFLGHLYITIVEILISFGLAAVSGLLLGFVLGVWKLLRDAYEPILSLLYAVPSVVWYPILLLTLGLDVMSKVAFGYILSFFPITLTTINAVVNVDKVLIRVAESMGASKLTVFYKVIIPASLPTILSGLSTGLALCVTGVLVGEMLGGIRGLGVLIASAATLFETAHYFAYVIVVIILALVVNYIGKLLERLSRGV